MRVEFLDLSRGGVALRLPQSVCAAIPEGQRVEIEFRPTAQGEPFMVPAEARHWREEDGGCRYGFKFLDPQKALERLDRAFWRLFNRRRAMRVAPAPETPVEVRLEWQDTSASGRLVDISTEGVTVELPAEKAGEESNRARVSLVLPESKEAMVVDGLIRYRMRKDDKIRCGVEFIIKRDDFPDSQMSILSEYVKRRESETKQDA